jgi:putative endonuclease
MPSEVIRVDDRTAVGGRGEELAAAHLEAAGMVVLQRNWRCPEGEIDIVARDGRDLVVCEVKTRRSAAYGPPAAAVTRPKLARLRRLAAIWLRAQPRSFASVRIDVVAVTLTPGLPAGIEHLRGVVR